MKYLVTLVIGLVLVGCAARELRVDCDGNLQPINVPAPVAHPGKVSP